MEINRQSLSEYLTDAITPISTRVDQLSMLLNALMENGSGHLHECAVVIIFAFLVAHCLKNPISMLIDMRR